MTLVCYCIQSSCLKRTYIGATNDFSRRIKQHNGILSGGAKATSGFQWSPIIHIVGFINRSQLLRFEWLWKHCIKSNERGIYRRINMLEYLLSKPEWGHLSVQTTEEIGSLIYCGQVVSELIE